MEGSPTLDEVLQALDALFSNPDTTIKENANTWLEQLQKSVHAWQIADQLLQCGNTLESCYFAAQTMRSKIQYSFYELPVESHVSLKESLMVHVSKINNETPPAINTQLSLALADLVLQMTLWNNALNEILTKFASKQQHINFLLEFLLVLPEELNFTRHLRLGANRRRELISEFNNCSERVADYLTTCIGLNDKKQLGLTYRCIGSWFSIGDEFHKQVMEKNLLHTVFQSLVDENTIGFLHEYSTDCICSALYSCEDADRRAHFLKMIYDRIMELYDPYMIAIAKEDIDRSTNFCRIFTELGESLMNKMISTPGKNLGSFNALELIIVCVGHHQYEIAMITYNFWFRLAEILYKKDNDETNGHFKPYFLRLITALCRHCQMEPDYEGILDEKGDFGEFRSKTIELIKDVIFVVGSSTVINQMFESLKITNLDNWFMCEAIIFVMTAIVRNIVPHDNVIIPPILEYILNILNSNSHISLKFVSLQFIRELSEWLNKHSEYLQAIVQILLTSLDNKDLVVVSCQALEHLCENCCSHMTPHMNGLLQLTNSVPEKYLTQTGTEALLRGTAAVLSKLGADQVENALLILCKQQLEPLKKILNETTHKNEPILYLNRLSTLFRSIRLKTTNSKHPALSAMGECWPVVALCCEKWASDVKISENSCRCIRFMVRCIGEKTGNFLGESIAHLIVKLYTNNHHSCYLYLASVLIDELGSNKQYTQGLVELLLALSNSALQQLSLNENSLKNNPDTIDDFFRMCLRFIQKMPDAFFNCAAADAITDCCVYAARLDHRDANLSACKFFSQIVDCSQKFPGAKELMLKHGSSYVKNVLRACVFDFPTYMLADMAENLFDMLQIERELLIKWLDEAITTLPTADAIAKVNVTPEQIHNIRAQLIGAQNFKTVLQTFRDYRSLYN